MYYKPVRVSNFWSNNCIEYGSNDDRNKTLSCENKGFCNIIMLSEDTKILEFDKF